MGFIVASVLSGTMSPSRGANVEAVDVVRAVAVFGLGLQHDAPGAAEAVEVVDVEPAEEGLQGIVDIGTSGIPRVWTLSVSSSTLYCGTLVRKDVLAKAELRTVAGGCQQRLGDLSELVDIGTARDLRP